MKKLTLITAAIGLFAFGASQALGNSASPRAASHVTIVMHDPGCHWFAANGTFKRTLAVNGPTRLMNEDESTLRIAGPAKVAFDKVGKPLTLTRGVYKITMVGQAPTDNHLKLTVR